jgi:hypothetical protein
VGLEFKKNGLDKSKMAPPDFYKVLKDFVTDLYTTFPELQSPILVQIRDAEERTPEIDAHYETVFAHVMKWFPERFFEILSENPEMFSSKCEILPDVDFQVLWASELSEKTRETIWKYLKLVLLIVANSGEKSDMFDFLKDEALKSKLDEATADLHGFFTKDTPDPETIHEQIKGLMTGKLGDLAKEIADDTIGKTPEQMQDMLKDPTKLFGLVGKVGETIDRKIKAGDLKESELLEEATAMFQKMKDMPGMGGFEAMFQKFAGKGKMDVGGMEAKMAQNMKKAKTKERLQRKLAEKKFSVGEPAEKSTREEKPVENTVSDPEKKKKKKR